MPSSANRSSGQRPMARELDGGSETARNPPTARSGAAHSATTAGLPNPLAVTTSKAPRRFGVRPTTSARSASTATRPCNPSAPTAWRRNAARRPCASTRRTDGASQRTASTSPGTPPPVPRSTREEGEVVHALSTASAKASACSNCASTGPGPRNPRSRASVRRPRRVARRWLPESPGTIFLANACSGRRGDDDEAVRLFSL